MNYNELRERKDKLEKIIKKINKELPNFPKGNLRIAGKGKSAQYFHVTEKDNRRGTYIKANNKKLACDLAKKSYYEKLLREAERESKAITSYITAMKKGKMPEDVYASLNCHRQELVSPLLINDAAYAAEWENTEYDHNTYNPEECIYETKKGDLVRSKSEAMIADMYYELGIPYRYEAKLTLKNGKNKYPDFTLLKLPQRKIIYHEHMGMMEDELYRANNICKLHEYSTSGINCCNNLIITFETPYAPLSMKNIRNMMRDVFEL